MVLASCGQHEPPHDRVARRRIAGPDGAVGRADAPAPCERLDAGRSDRCHAGPYPIQSDDPRAADRAYHLYTFRYAPGVEGLSRERFVEALQAEGIPCSAGYPVPLYKQPLFRHVQHPPDLPPYHELELPQVTQLCNEVIWLTQNLLLGTAEDTRTLFGPLRRCCRMPISWRGSRTRRSCSKAARSKPGEPS